MGMNRWWALFVLFFTRVMLGFQFQAVASTAPSLIDAFSIDYTAIGTLVGLFTLPGLVCSLPAGMIGKKLGNRRAVALGILLMTAGGIATGFADHFAVAAAGRLVSGVGAIALFVLLTKMTSDWFDGDKQLGVAMSFVINAWPIGIGLGILFHGAIENAFSWRGVFWSTSIFSLLALGLLWKAYRDPRPLSGQGQSSAAPASTAISLREILNVSGSAIGLTLYNAAAIIILSFVPTLLVSTGLSKLAAGSVVNFYIVTTIIGVSLGGYLAASRHRTLVTFVCCIGSALALAATAYASLSVSLYVILGIFAGIPCAYLMTLPLAYLAPSNRDVGFGIFYTWVYGGLGILMMISGYIRDHMASPASPIYFAALLLALVPFATLLFQLVSSGKLRGIGIFARQAQ